MLGPSEVIQRAISRLQNKLTDVNVQLLGTGGTTTFLISLTQDKYQNKEYIINEYRPIFTIINFPGNEIPIMSMGTNDNQTANNVLHMYNILPITAFFRFEDNVKKGNIILHKIKMPDGKYQVLPLELLAPIAQVTRTNIVYMEWTINMVTNNALLKLPIFTKLLEDYKLQDNW